MSDEDGLEGGDLGLGKGLKPGALSPIDARPGRSDSWSTHDTGLPGKSAASSLSRLNSKFPGHAFQSDKVNEQCVHCNLSIAPDKHSATTSDSEGASHSLCSCSEQDSSSFSHGNTKEGNDTVKAEEHKKARTKLSQVTDKLRQLRKSKSESHAHVNPFTSERLSQDKDVQIGRSFSEQETLFKKDLHSIVHMNTARDNFQSNRKTNDGGKKTKEDIDTIEASLQQAHEEVDILKQQLEMCHRQLEGKYQAIEVLQLQSNSLQDEQQDNQQKAKQMNKEFQKEISELQFELECQESSLMYSQQTWAERFDRVSQENSALITTLEDRTEEIRKVCAEKMAVTRERDELLALLDVQERQQYDNSRNTQDTYQSFTSAELAVLGACHCRGRNPEPCTCACAAANMKRDLSKTKKELEQNQKKCQEFSVTADAYRIAFEEELARNRTVIRKLADLSSTLAINKTSKARAAVRWLVKQLNEDEETMNRLRSVDLMNGGANESTPENADQLDMQLEEKTDEELIHMLVDMVNDKSEALAHQRLAARMLASKTKELEEKLSANGNVELQAREDPHL